MVVAATVLDTLPVTSTDGVNKVLHQLSDILGVTVEQ
jgi:hypothetical protein